MFKKYKSFGRRFSSVLEYQKKWNEQILNQSRNPDSPDMFYCLGQFPYPSGKLHLGHFRVYSIADIITKYELSRGKHVINPIGWDSFGLPAENASIARKVSKTLPLKIRSEQMDRCKHRRNEGGFEEDRLATRLGPRSTNELTS
jgi:leucyl-tRNA synthetase